MAAGEVRSQNTIAAMGGPGNDDVAVLQQQAGPLPTQDAAIPMDRVPYFRSDLRRIAITAALMFVLLIAGSIVLRSLLQA